MQRYRTKTSLFWGWVFVAGGIAAGLSQIFLTEKAEPSVGWGLAAALALTGYVGFLLPSLRLGEDSLVVTNIFEVATVPYARIERIEGEVTLVVEADDGQSVVVNAASHQRPGEAQSRGGDNEPAVVAGKLARAAWDSWRERTGGGTGAQHAQAVEVRKNPQGYASVILIVCAIAAMVFL